MDVVNNDYETIKEYRFSNSKTFVKWQFFNLSEKNRLALLVFKSCTNAYLTLKNTTWILYFHSQFYKPGYEKSIKYNNLKFNFDWPKKVKAIPKKDNSIKFL
jgi:dTDP-4-dehydrorhamnose 3,5-epimerase